LLNVRAAQDRARHHARYGDDAYHAAKLRG
jgi:hypothetical protein